MIIESKAWLKYLLIGAGLVISTLLSPCRALSEEIAVVVNSNVEAKSISSKTLRSIFGMRLRSWEDGSKIVTYVLPDRHPLHRSFSKEILGVFPHQLRWSWDRLVFSGTGEAPIVVNTEDELLAKLSDNPGAIGYVEGGERIVDSENLRVLAIIN